MNKFSFWGLTLVMALLSGGGVAIVKELTDAPVFVAISTVLSAFLILKLPRIILNRSKESQEPREVNIKKSKDIGAQFSEAWKYYLISVCLLVIASGFFINPPEELTLPYVLGFNLPFVLMVWLFFHFAFLRSKVFGKSGLCFFAILISTIISTFVAHKNDVAANKDERISSGSPYSGEYEATIQGNELEDINDAAQAKKLFKILLSETQKLNQTYQAKLNNLGWGQVAEASYELHNSPKILSERLEVVSRAKELAREYKGKAKQLIETLPTLASDINFSGQRKAELLGAIRNNPTEYFLTTDNVWNLELEIIGAMGEALEVLENSPGKWVVENNELLFFDELTMQEYNSKILEIQSLMKEQNKLYKKTISNGQLAPQ